MNTKIENLQQDIWRLDTIDEVFGLEEEEANDRQKSIAALYTELRVRNTLLAQKLRLRWIKDVDANSKLFHSYINSRRKKNEIVRINIEGQWVEEVEDVKKGIFEFFKHFQGSDYQRPTLTQDFTHSRISGLDNQFLISPFSEDEVKETVLSCEGSRSPGPDGLNFAFLKEVWYTLKADIMQMVMEFHEFDKLVKDINPSFIVLIPKKDVAVNLNAFYVVIRRKLASIYSLNVG